MSFSKPLNKYKEKPDNEDIDNETKFTKVNSLVWNAVSLMPDVDRGVTAHITLHLARIVVRLVGRSTHGIINFGTTTANDDGC